MTANPYYKTVNGRTLISAAGTALLLGLDPEQVANEVRVQDGQGAPVLTMPDEWRKRGNRIRKECWAALGYEADVLACIDYLASKA